MLAPGSSFGRYVIEALIGTGGMGLVFRAQDTRLGRRVALKLLTAPRHDVAQWGEAVARMLREARAAANLEHPSAVQIYDVGEMDGTPYIAMEFVRGRQLRDFVGDASVPWEVKLRWLLDAAGALAAAHDAGLVHRDVKPRNVMVREDGRVKVLDFGLARRAATGGTEAPASEDVATITTEGMVVGTPQYMPPEQLAGAPLDGRADQFAWAVMAYELFAGTRPWPGHSDLLATVTAILTTPAAPLASHAPFLPLPVTDAIHKALAKLPEGRFPSMHELVAQLDPYAAPSPLLASARQRAGAAASSTPTLPDSGSSPISGSQQTRAARGVTVDGMTPVGGAPAPSVPPGRRWVAAVALGLLAVLAGGAVAVVRRPRAAATSTVPSAPSAPSAITLRDLPAPASTVPEALTVYREGVQAQHDANEVVARHDLLDALHRDPALGAAHLRYALLDFLNDVTEARTYFLKAQQLRASLPEHERVLLDAAAPLFVENPTDWQGAASRLEKAHEARPADVELLYFLGWARQRQGRSADASRALDAALALEPGYAAALDARIGVLQLGSDPASVVEATDTCLRAAPTATACLKRRLWTDAELGSCQDYERDARRVVAIDPGNAEGYEDLGQLSLALGRPVDAAFEWFRAGWKHLSPSAAPLVEADDRARTAAVQGDSRALDLAMADVSRINADSSEQWPHFEETELLVAELTELGAAERAAQVADDYLRRRSAWTVDPGLNPWTVASDDVPVMLQALLRAGRIGRAELDRRRDEWIASWRARLSPEVSRYLWMYAYAQLADTPADATRALELERDFDPIPRFRPLRFMSAHIGHTFLLAGRAPEALPYLRRAASQCEPFEEPFTWNRATLWLGEALEATGSSAEACAEYERAAGRWAGFGTRSVTVKEARRRLKALRCGG